MRVRTGRNAIAVRRRRSLRIIPRRVWLAIGALLLGAPAAGQLKAQEVEGCNAVAVRSPLAGSILRGEVNIYGSAAIDNFQFYKLEWAPAGDPENWHAVSQTIAEPKRNTLLDVWRTAPLGDGSYRLKLTAVNDQAEEPCRETVEGLRIQNLDSEEGSPSPEASPEGTAPATITAVGVTAEPDEDRSESTETSDPVPSAEDAADPSPVPRQGNPNPEVETTAGQTEDSSESSSDTDPSSEEEPEEDAEGDGSNAATDPLNLFAFGGAWLRIFFLTFLFVLLAAGGITLYARRGRK